LIATDEIHHYGLFYKYLQKYLQTEPMTKIERARVAVGRSVEAGDEELLFAYAATNLQGPIRAADLKSYSKEYFSRVFPTYSLKHIRLGIKMACRAAGLENSPRLVEMISRVVFATFQTKARFLNRRRWPRFEWRLVGS
jgi:hypothetical protein